MMWGNTDNNDSKQARVAQNYEDGSLIDIDNIPAVKNLKMDNSDGQIEVPMSHIGKTNDDMEIMEVQEEDEQQWEEAVQQSSENPNQETQVESVAESRQIESTKVDENPMRKIKKPGQTENYQEQEFNPKKITEQSQESSRQKPNLSIDLSNSTPPLHATFLSPRSRELKLAQVSNVTISPQ